MRSTSPPFSPSAKLLTVPKRRSNADSIVDGVFVEPANVPLPLSSFFQHLKEEEAASETEREGMPVLYLQSQNGNMAGEFESLRGDVGGEGPAWAREVFGAFPFLRPCSSSPSLPFHPPQSHNTDFELVRPADCRRGTRRGQPLDRRRKEHNIDAQRPV